MPVRMIRRCELADARVPVMVKTRRVGEHKKMDWPCLTAPQQTNEVYLVNDGGRSQSYDGTKPPRQREREGWPTSERVYIGWDVGCWGWIYTFDTRTVCWGLEFCPCHCAGLTRVFVRIEYVHRLPPTPWRGEIMKLVDSNRRSRPLKHLLFQRCLRIVLPSKI